MTNEFSDSSSTVDVNSGRLEGDSANVGTASGLTVRIRGVNEINSCAVELNETDDDNSRCSPSNTKRKIPSWMLGLGSPSSTQINDRQKKQKYSKNSPNKNKSDPLQSLDSIENFEKLSNEDVDVKSNSYVESPLIPNNNNKVEIKQEIKDEPLSYDLCSASNSARNVNSLAPPQIVKQETSSTTEERESCQYGIRCYRRNPRHKIEMAHPGDNDYKRPNYPPPPIGTPQCSYGDTCYRRNPQHFQEYSHPPSTDFEGNRMKRKKQKKQDSKPTRTKRNTNIKIKNEQSNNEDTDFDDDDDENEEDPFATNSSEDEYLPSDHSDSDDSGEEDDIADNYEEDEE